MLLPAGILPSVLAQSANFIFKTVSFVGTVTSKTHFQPFAKVLSAVANVWTALICVTPKTAESARAVFVLIKPAPTVKTATKNEETITRVSLVFIFFYNKGLINNFIQLTTATMKSRSPGWDLVSK